VPLPGYQVNIIETPPGGQQYVDIATLFAVGKAQKEDFGLVYSIDQFNTLFGDRQPGSSLYDGVQVFFREGGFRAYVASVPMTADAEAIAEASTQFVSDYGPGTLTAFGETDNEVHLALAEQTAIGRIALLDAPDTAVVADLISASAAITGEANLHGDRFSAMFAPWDVAPGLVPGTTRTVPPSARVAGNLARNDAQGYSSGDPASGVLGIAKYVQSLSQPAWSDADRQTLNEASINVSRMVQMGVRTYGWRSLADQVLDQNWTMFNGSRTIMAIKSSLNITAENFVFSKLDSMARVTAKYAGAISNVCLEYYNNGDLYGDTSKEAFSVDTGPAVNTDASFAQGILSANVGLRTASMAEQVIINIAKVPITESLTTS
jgi:phage tail sheath protein FI